MDLVVLGDLVVFDPIDLPGSAFGIFPAFLPVSFPAYVVGALSCTRTRTRTRTRTCTRTRTLAACASMLHVWHPATARFQYVRIQLSNRQLS